MLALKDYLLTMVSVNREFKFHMMPSGCAPDGSIVLIRCPETTRLTVAFEDDGSSRDHTAWMADFAMIGWFNAANSQPVPLDEKEIAHLILTGAVVEEIEAWWVHPASGSARVADGVTLMHHVARGIAVQIAEAVATEILESEQDLDEKREKLASENL